MNLEILYRMKRATPESINEHMDTLRKYAEQSDHIVEFGVMHGFSTIAFLAGRPKELHSYDILRQVEIDQIEFVAAGEGLNFTFHLQSSLEAQFESTDLLFLDSLHNYEQVRDELALHGHKAKKFLIFHDTIAFAYMDQIATHLPAHPHYSLGHKKGIGPAIEEYMTAHPEWQIIEHHYHQSGLTVYKRV